jgi:NAD-dependent SIR2 family protein deacetylase
MRHAATAAQLHANCGRARCEDCTEDFDECEARHRDEDDAVLCDDCHAGRTVHAEDEAAWRAYAYR